MRLINKFYYTAILLVLISSLWSCQETAQEEKLSTINPSINVPIIRYEKELINLKEIDITEGVSQLRKNYPTFSEVYFRQIMALPTDDKIIDQEVNRMVSDSGFYKLYTDVEEIYQDLADVQPEINQTIENYQSLFEVAETPNLYTFISGFVYQCFLFDDVDRDGIGVGLDMFLGSDFPYAQVDPTNAGFSAYLTRSFDKQHLTKKIAEVLVEDQMSPPNKSDFLSLMILNGKKLYLIDQILSFKSDTIVMEYTADQYEWCQDNELAIWDFFFDADLFYETDLRKFNKLIGPSPTSPGMPPESPGRTANYMGWQIIKAYMNRYPNTTVRQLLEMDDAQKILDDSKFKPRRTT